jgi:hypothetical protein
MHILPERPAPQTGSKLFRFCGVIALDPKNTVVFDMQAKRTSTPTVKCRGRAHDFYIGICIADRLIAHFNLLINPPWKIEHPGLKDVVCNSNFLGLSAGGLINLCCAFILKVYRPN